MKREGKKRLWARDLKQLGANPDRPRLRIPPPEGSRRTLKPKRDADRGEGGR